MIDAPSSPLNVEAETLDDAMKRFTDAVPTGPASRILGLACSGWMGHRCSVGRVLFNLFEFFSNRICLQLKFVFTQTQQTNLWTEDFSSSWIHQVLLWFLEK